MHNTPKVQNFWYVLPKKLAAQPLNKEILNACKCLIVALVAGLIKSYAIYESVMRYHASFCTAMSYL